MSAARIRSAVARLGMRLTYCRRHGHGTADGSYGRPCTACGKIVYPPRPGADRRPEVTGRR